MKRLLLTLILVTSFLGIAVFGLLPFGHTSHATEMPMVNCPYAENGYSVCENTFEHINNWRQFSNVTIPSLFVLSLIILGIVLYLFSKQDLLNQKKLHFYKWKYYTDDRKSHTDQERIIKWLSLFENSPSFSL